MMFFASLKMMLLHSVPQCEMKFSHIREANISHLQSKYFTAKLFHLPARANFVEKSTYLSGRQMCAFFWRRGRDSNPRVLSHKLISSQPRYDHFDISPYYKIVELFCSTKVLYHKLFKKSIPIFKKEKIFLSIDCGCIFVFFN